MSLQFILIVLISTVLSHRCLPVFLSVQVVIRPNPDASIEHREYVSFYFYHWIQTDVYWMVDCFQSQRLFQCISNDNINTQLFPFYIALFWIEKKKNSILSYKDCWWIEEKRKEMAFVDTINKIYTCIDFYENTIPLRSSFARMNHTPSVRGSMHVHSVKRYFIHGISSSSWFQFVMWMRGEVRKKSHQTYTASHKWAQLATVPYVVIENLVVCFFIDSRWISVSRLFTHNNQWWKCKQIECSVW